MATEGEIRAWAREQDRWQINRRGKLPREVHEAYAEAHPEVTQQQGEETLWEDDQVDPDPAPAREAGGLRDALAGPSVRVTARVKRDIRAKLAFMGTPLVSIWEMRDPLCGGVAAQQADGIYDSLTEIIADSPDLVRFFTGPGGGFMKYLDLTLKCLPIVQVVFAHHLIHSIGQESEGGDGDLSARLYPAPEPGGHYVATG